MFTSRIPPPKKKLGKQHLFDGTLLDHEKNSINDINETHSRVDSTVGSTSLRDKKRGSISF